MANLRVPFNCLNGILADTGENMEFRHIIPSSIVNPEYRKSRSLSWTTSVGLYYGKMAFIFHYLVSKRVVSNILNPIDLLRPVLFSESRVGCVLRCKILASGLLIQ